MKNTELEIKVKEIMSKIIKPVHDNFNSCPVEVSKQIYYVNFDINQCELNNDLGAEYEALKVVLDSLINLLKVFPSK